MPLASTPPRLTDPRPRTWTADEFEAMRGLGLFRGQGVELIDGVVYELHRDSDPTPHRWTVPEYYAMGDRGLFLDQRVELIGGEIVVLSPQNWGHTLALTRVARALERAFGAGCWARTQLPLSLAPGAQPEPDVSVVGGSADDYSDHPTTAHLVVEVSETSLPHDRRKKASLYARADISEYWIVNLIDRQVEVHRDPVADPAQPFGSRYSTISVVKPGRSITPLAAPDARVAVADLLP